MTSFNKYNTEDYYKKIENKIYNWWVKLAIGNIIIIYKDGTNKLIKSSKKTNKGKINEIIKKWKEYNIDENIKVIIWSSQSVDIIQSFILKLIKNSTKTELEEFIKMKNLSDYLIKNYKKYFKKTFFIGEKDYHLKI